ncbi:MAG: teichoic acid D-Ala incorporation-associated protein DltX [Lactobacillales bacterium]|nr:teichoic acid D-Ala incorporation-associated protein DltX [Lactobacillales bacterium]
MKKFTSNRWGKFLLQSVFYAVVILGLLYLYHYNHSLGGTFIYNEF